MPSCVRFCQHAAEHGTTVHASPAFWPGLVIAVLAVAYWLNEKLREPGDVVFTPDDDWGDE